MAHKNPFEIKTKSDGSYFGSYTDPKMAISPISSANGKKPGLIGSGESSEVINDAMSMAKDNPTGFNRNLNKRIKRADNIAQQTRLNIKLDKKEQRQEKRAQKMLDRNPEYAKRAAEEAAQGNAKKVLTRQANTAFHPTNIPKLREIKEGGARDATSIPKLKSSIPAHNTTGSTLDVARRGKQGTGNTSRGGGGRTPGSGKVVSNIGLLTGAPGSYSNQSVFGSGERNMGFGGGNPLSKKQSHNTPKVKSSIHSRNSWGINKPNTEKYL